MGDYLEKRAYNKIREQLSGAKNFDDVYDILINAIKETDFDSTNKQIKSLLTIPQIRNNPDLMGKALWTAAGASQEEIVKIILEVANNNPVVLNWVNPTDGTTPLIIAIKNSSTSVVDFLSNRPGIEIQGAISAFQNASPINFRKLLDEKAHSSMKPTHQKRKIRSYDEDLDLSDDEDEDDDEPKGKKLKSIIQPLLDRFDEEERLKIDENSKRLEKEYAAWDAIQGMQLQQEKGGKSRRKRKNKTAKKTKRRKTVKRRKINKRKSNKRRR